MCERKQCIIIILLQWNLFNNDRLRDTITAVFLSRWSSRTGPFNAGFNEEKKSKGNNKYGRCSWLLFLYRWWLKQVWLYIFTFLDPLLIGEVHQRHQPTSLYPGWYHIYCPSKVSSTHVANIKVCLHYMLFNTSIAYATFLHGCLFATHAFLHKTIPTN